MPAASTATPTALLDAWELTQGLDPTTNADGAGVDSDGDTPSNGEEFGYGTDPLVADMDGDGATDAQEVGGVSDPWDPDSDDDGLTDGQEINGPPTSNPLDPDSDDDGLGDYAEVITHGTNPNLADSDTDGYSDPQELAAGTDPNLNTSVPNVYFQTFDSFADGTRNLIDGSSVEGTGATSVQGGDFRFLQDGVNSQSSIYRLPPLAGSDEAWCVSFDFVTGSQVLPRTVTR